METKKHQLPKEFAEKWVSALRSGEYEQGNGRLKKNGNQYCCLGVACVLSGASDKQIGDYAYIPKNSKISVPRLIKGNAMGKGIIYQLSTMNDGGYSFSEIADWIEANVQFI